MGPHLGAVDENFAAFDCGKLDASCHGHLVESEIGLKGHWGARRLRFFSRPNPLQPLRGGPEGGSSAAERRPGKRKRAVAGRLARGGRKESFHNW